MSVADQIVIAENDPEQLTCGMKSCPFHQWTNLTGQKAPIESVCNLPGDSGNVLWVVGCNPDLYEREYAGYIGIKRLRKCLEAKPPQS